MTVTLRRPGSRASRAAAEALIIVTGGRGFLGSAVAATLQRQERPALILGRAASGNGLGKALRAIPAAQRRSAVMVHLAGWADARAAQRRPAAAFKAIVALTDLTVRACADARVAKCLVVSTAAVYGRQPQQPVSEEAPLLPQGAYAGWKAAAELAARGQMDQGPLALEIVRLSNVIGPGMHRASVIQELWTQMRAGRDPVTVQAAAPRRDYLHVEDAVAALLAVAQLPSSPGMVRVFNAGTGIGTSVKDVVERLATIAGRPVPMIRETAPEDARAFDLVLDAARLRAATGWAPSKTIQESLQEAVRHAR